MYIKPTESKEKSTQFNVTRFSPVKLNLSTKVRQINLTIYKWVSALFFCPFATIEIFDGISLVILTTSAQMVIRTIKIMLNYETGWSLVEWLHFNFCSWQQSKRLLQNGLWILYEQQQKINCFQKNTSNRREFKLNDLIKLSPTLNS